MASDLLFGRFKLKTLEPKNSIGSRGRVLVPRKGGWPKGRRRNRRGGKA